MKPSVDKTKRHELSLFVMNGAIYPTSTDRFKDIVFSPPYIAVSILFLAAMMIGEVAIYGYDGGYFFQALFWVLAFIVFITLWYWQFVLLCIFKPSRAPRAIPTVALHILPLWFTITVTKTFSYYWMGTFSGLEFPNFLDVFRLLLLTVVFEFMVTKWVLPFVPGTRAANARMQATAATKQYKIDDKSFFMDDLVFLRSAEHYVELVTVDGSSLHRAKIGDIIAQFSGADGIQPHRSYWVPRGSVEAVICKNKKKVMILKNGDEIPVSRGRQDGVCDWFERNIAEQKKTGHKARPVQQGGVMP